METITEVKERPILFTGEMVRAILEGKKTQTRRVINPQPAAGMTVAECMWVNSGWAQCEDLGEGRVGRCKCSGAPVSRHHGHVRDRLYVRENFHMHKIYDDYRPGNVPETKVWYDAEQGVDRYQGFFYRGRKRPSIHMPKWASRITLELTSVRVGRVQDITDPDILAEGITVPLASRMTGIPWSDMPNLHDAWRYVWDLINDGRGYGWNVNPWCWVLEFKIV